MVGCCSNISKLILLIGKKSLRNSIKMKNYFLVCFIFCAFFYQAQTTTLKPGSPNELDQKYTPSGTAIFSESQSGSNANNNTGKSKTSESEFKNAVKCNIAMFTRSIAAFSYERFLSNEVSFEGSLGFAYKKDAMFETFGLSTTSSSSGSTQVQVKIPLKVIYGYGKQNGMGYYFGGTIKFHFYNGCWYSNMYSGMYGGGGFGNSDMETYLELNVRGYSNKFLMVSDTSSTGSTQGAGNQYADNSFVNVRHMNYLLNYGVRFTTGGKIKTSHELYTGAGIRNVTYDLFESVTVSTFPLQIDKYTLTGQRGNSMTPIFVMGYILGFGW